jgi:hypothetical protein
MEQIKTFVDDRLAAYCGTCHGVPSTRDHAPAKVFLDEPNPENLPVVGACASCNQDASLDEELVRAAVLFRRNSPMPVRYSYAARPCSTSPATVSSDATP